MIYTGVEAEKAFTIEGDILVSKFLEPLIIVDDKEVSEEAMALIKSEDVASVNVFEPHSKVAKSYGEKGSKGVIMVTTKTAKNLSVATNPLVVVDGKEASYEELGKIDPDKIANVTALKAGSDAAKAYGDKGKKGVILVTTKAGGKKK